MQLPAALARLAGFLTDEIWPVLWPVVSQPIIWLAVAALVFGSQVLSLAELWRRGQPDRRPGAGGVGVRPAHRQARAAPDRPPPPGVRRVGAEVKEAFLGDLDDKYLPTFHSSGWCCGPVRCSSGAYVLLYTAHRGRPELVERLIPCSSSAGRDGRRSGTVAGPFIDLVKNVPWELLRLCLLAVAFRRCLELFQQRGRQLSPGPSEVGAEPLAPGPSVASGAPA